MEVSCLSLNPRNAMPFQFLPLTYRPQRRSPPMQVSCRATKMDAEDKTQNVNFYKLLSLSPKTATMDEIKRAYRSMALQYHPDVCHDPSMKKESTRMFVQLNAAYKILSNPMLREEYDCDLGLRSKRSIGDERWRIRWQEQIVELKRRSNRRMAKRDGSWSSRMRAQNRETNN
ncbi:hypothetical protein L6164_036298 [Bauhinia variegata]|uniref:Uncharacterized protein n=1 Tax=Bauhinia variegata TaxID=167791 RepID=A0ACB9KGL8_BAUVA|nr:hypothetical protein L6164_036298 [Bauhinia variegata]